MLLFRCEEMLLNAIIIAFLNIADRALLTLHQFLISSERVQSHWRNDLILDIKKVDAKIRLLCFLIVFLI